MSRKLIIWGFVLSTLFTTGLTLSGGYVVKSVEQAQTDRRVEVEKYQTPADAMDHLVTLFMDRYLVGKQSVDERRALQTNIQAQWNALANIQPSLSADDAKLTKQYQEEIVVISDQLDQLPAPGDAQSLVQAIATARNTRVDVTERLRQRARRWI